MWNRVVIANEAVNLSAAQRVGDWQLDETAGNTAIDASAFKRPLITSAGAVWGFRGIAGALSLDGTAASNAATGGPVVYTDQSFAVSAWVRLNSLDA